MVRIIYVPQSSKKLIVIADTDSAGICGCFADNCKEHLCTRFPKACRISKLFHAFIQYI